MSISDIEESPLASGCLQQIFAIGEYSKLANLTIG
jgi:hypothetical protein